MVTLLDRPRGAAVWAWRARQSWSAFAGACLSGRGGRLRVHEPGTAHRLPGWPGSRVASWPLSQVIWAASALGGLDAVESRPATVPDPDDLWLALRWYRDGDGYLDHRPRGRRYYDDNAWLGLAAGQQALLTGAPRWWDRAGALGRFVLRGVHEVGGVCWVEDGDTVNACSTGSGALLFDVLAADAPGLSAAERAHLAAAGDAGMGFLVGPLLRSDGLVADHRRADGSIEPSVWAYNQGLLLQAASRRGDDAVADAIVAAVGTGLPPGALREQPAAFTCIWWRAVLGHAARQSARGPLSEPVRQALAGVADYLAHAWDRGRGEDGLFRRISRYDQGVVLDHAAITGLMAAYAAGAQVWQDLL